MNIVVRLANGQTDSFRDAHWEEGMSHWATSHSYEVGPDETLTITKTTFDSNHFGSLIREVASAQVGYYRPSQWTSIREG